MIDIKSCEDFLRLRVMQNRRYENVVIGYSLYTPFKNPSMRLPLASHLMRDFPPRGLSPTFGPETSGHDESYERKRPQASVSGSLHFQISTTVKTFIFSVNDVCPAA